MTAAWDGVERRRTPRVTVEASVECRLVLRARVQVLDLSATGAVVTSDTFLPTGSVGQLRTALAAGGFAPVVRVLRNSPGRHPDRRELGVRFQDMDHRSREHLETFLKRTSH